MRLMKDNVTAIRSLAVTVSHRSTTIDLNLKTLATAARRLIASVRTTIDYSDDDATAVCRYRRLVIRSDEKRWGGDIRGVSIRTRDSVWRPGTKKQKIKKMILNNALFYFQSEMSNTYVKIWAKRRLACHSPLPVSDFLSVALRVVSDDVCAETVRKKI